MRRWTPDMDAKLASLHGTMPRADVAAALGVSDGAVRARVTRLGIGRDTSWSEAEIDALRAAYDAAGADQPINLRALSERLGRDRSNICRKARQIGLSTSQRRYKKDHSVYRDGARPSQAKYDDEERSRVRSERMRKRHAENPHPMLGKSHTAEALEQISEASKRVWQARTPREKADFIEKCHKASIEKNGWVVPPQNRQKASWKAGWREIGGQRAYFRSSWEANYARYLQWLKSLGEIADWKHEPETFWFDAIKRGVRSYKPDFRVWECDGSSHLVEVKGWMDSRSRTTLRRMKKYHPTERVDLVDSKAYRKLAKQVSGLVEGWE
jgi:hypothetical protein